MTILSNQVKISIIVMANHMILANRDGFSLVKLTEMDNFGNILSVTYQVYGSEEGLLGSFGSLEEALQFFESKLSEQHGPRF